MATSTSAGHSREKSATQDQREIEWQFDVSDAREVERWLDEGGRRGGLSVGGGEVKRLTDSYLDTADWRLYRAGFALRLRRRGKQSEAAMKSLASTAGTPGLRERREISEPLKDSRPARILKAPGPVGERVRALVGPRRLEVLFDIQTRRVAYDLFAGDERVAEVSLDDTGIPAAEDEEPLRLQRVEVEAVSEDLTSLEPFVGELRAAFGLSPGVSSKYRSGLRARGLAPPGPPEFGSETVKESLTLGETAFAVMRGQFVAFLTHEPGARLGEDPEELHDMRVASRRLRAAMRLFEDALPVRARRMNGDLRHFAGILGEVRDLDVQIERLSEMVGSSPAEREPLKRLTEALGERRAKARERMLGALDSDRYERFVEEFGTVLERGPSGRTRAAGQPVLAAAPGIVGRRYRKVRKAGDGLAPDSPPEDYHRLRKRGKRLRYALEFFSGAYGKPAEKLISQLKSLQDVLGDHQDSVVAVRQLRELVSEDGLSPQTVFAMGGVAHRYETEAASLRAEVPKAYKGIKGKRWKRFKKTMDQKLPRTETREK